MNEDKAKQGNKPNQNRNRIAMSQREREYTGKDKKLTCTRKRKYKREELQDISKESKTTRMVEKG